jgi:hypothetical protein
LEGILFFRRREIGHFTKRISKKTQETPKKELEKAIRLMNEYYKEKKQQMKTKSWSKIKDDVYGKKGTERRDTLERDFEKFQNWFVTKKSSRR